MTGRPAATGRSWKAARSKNIEPIIEIRGIRMDVSLSADIAQQSGSIDEAIDKARFLSRSQYYRKVLVTVDDLEVARFLGRYWLDNPDKLPAPKTGGLP